MPECKVVRIGGASAFWGDSVLGPVQLARQGDVDYLMFDYLAELTMSILVRARRKDPSLGYATDFVNDAMRSILREVAARGIRVIANAGGINPRGCAQALAAVAGELGVAVRIGVVEGDDLLDRADALRAAGVREMDTGEPLPATVTSINAYLGAFPIARALAGGAQIVVTGRCVDSAMALGPLIHEFGWRADDYDLLAAGSVVGHLLECGTQVTGGLHTDWTRVPDWAGIGYPIAECAADGSFVLTKPTGTGGLVDRFTAGEQMLYEIGDPAHYALPDVTVDFRGVTLTPAGENRVRVAGAVGRPPSDTVKVSATWDDGWRGVMTRTVVGDDAVAKAHRHAAEVTRRLASLLEARGLAPIADRCVEVLGSEVPSFGAAARRTDSREVVLRLAVKHADRRAIQIFAREIAAFGTAGAPGTTGSGGRPDPQPVLRMYSFLLPKQQVRATVSVDAHAPTEVPFARPAAVAPAAATADVVDAPRGAPVPRFAPGTRLCDVAVGRSGDKGDNSNVGLIARRPQDFERLWACVTPEWVRAQLGHLVAGEIERYRLPGVAGINLLLRRALGGGGMASLRNDPLGKTVAHILLACELEPVPGSTDDRIVKPSKEPR